ncbi:MAG: glycosyltransferase family 87 protein [Thermoplasmata archaeon]
MDDEKDLIGEKLRFPIPTRRLLYLIIGIIFINYSFVVWMVVGYLYLVIIVFQWALILVGGVLVIYSVFIGTETKIVKSLPMIGFALAFAIFVGVIGLYVPPYGTDELAADTYAAYLFLHGRNPYVDANMASVFTNLHFPPYMITPLLKGGAVTYLVYPGLSVLLFLPAVQFQFRSYIIILFFDFVSILLIYYYYRKTGFTSSIPFLIIVMIMNMEYLDFSFNGGDDIIWVTFIGLSYVFRKKPWLSGLFFGLSLSYKQIGAIIFPFYLYFIFMENDQRKKDVVVFFLFVLISFFATNIPFILMSPYLWFTHVASIASQPIIGVGLGPSILAFAGYLYIPSIIFGVIMVLFLLAFLFIYIGYYFQLKYSFFAFPMIIFFFDYRSLENYIIYWPYLIFLLMPDFAREYILNYKSSSTKHLNYNFKGFLGKIDRTLKSKKNVTLLLSIAIILTGTFASAGYAYSTTSQMNEIRITSVFNASDPYLIPNSITTMQVNLTYTPVQGSPMSTNVSFRIFYNTLATSNLNSLLWSPVNSIVHAGNNTITIIPNYYPDILPNNVTFTIIAYYGSMQSPSYHQGVPFNLKMIYPMKNPTLSYPTYTFPEVYPSWNLSNSKDNGITSSYSQVNGIILNGSRTSDVGGPTYSNLSTQFNMSLLSGDNFSMSYNIQFIRSHGYNNTEFSNGKIISFFGIRLSFSQGSKFLWIGYNNTATGSANDLFAYSEINAESYIVIVNDTYINFAQIANVVSSIHQWNVSLDSVTLNVIASVYPLNATYSVHFYNFTLYKNDSIFTSPFVPAGSYYSNESINYVIGISQAVIPAADVVRIE